ncbi:hypothetical protein KP509_22G007000 [Ceratopteris richardii]|nr:hypothetical protein KP509_22G007000 [Ceratopteris richardii]
MPPPSSAPPSPPAEMVRPPDDDTPFTPESGSSDPIAWCAVRDEISECRTFVAMLNDASSATWTCEKRDSRFECMHAIMKGEADLMSLDAGLAYIAFMNFHMKAIMMEEYCYFAKSYEVVAIVHKEECSKNPSLSLKDFRGKESCHGGYLTAAGWNYPVQFLVDSGLQAVPKKTANDTERRDDELISSFFSSSCAPSELEGQGVCTSCGNNGSCTTDSYTYAGHAGAFRCLMDGTGDIAFLRSGTAERLSADGIHAQEWSTKALEEFRYLCPQGGCRSINENIENCTFGSVPANVIMTRNSQPNSRRLVIVEQLLNASYSQTLYKPQNWNDYVLSSRTQNLVETKELTRQVLGNSAVISQKVETLGEDKSEVTAAFLDSGSHLLCVNWLLLICFTLLYIFLWSQ